MVAAGTLLLVAGWWLLATAMPPRGAPPPGCRRALRVAGGCALAASLGLYVAAIGIGQGPVFWIAALMLAALGVALLRAVAGDDGSRRRRRD